MSNKFDDTALFQHMMQGVVPLRQTRKEPAVYHRQPMTRQRSPDVQEPLVARPLAPFSDPYDMPFTAHSILHYESHRLPSKRIKQLKQGHVAIEARLDLHGMPLAVARDALWQFILTQYQHDTRCILIIHGKGGKHGEKPVLKNYIAHWLKQCSEILAYHSALPRDGGTGAICALLRKKPIN